jgi:nucleotide-binding universal stress UspA family protein
MDMYKKILVPIDGSDTADAGLKEAIWLAKDQGAQIRIVHIIDAMPLVSVDTHGAVFDQIVEQLRTAGVAIVATGEALVRGAGVPVDSQLVEALGGSAGEQVVRAAKEWRADIIVCGTHGRRGLRRILMGSDAEYMVRCSHVPILLVRAAGQE